MPLMKTLTALAAMCLAPIAAFAENENAKRFEDLTFVPQRPGSPVEVAVLWGDPATGPSGVLLKMPAGAKAPTHMHSASYRAIIIEGAPSHMLEGANEPAKFGPGSYIYQPAGEYHSNANDSGEDALIMVIYDGPMDAKPKQ